MSVGLMLYYILKWKGFMYYVIGQVKEIVFLFYNLDVDVKILNKEVINLIIYVVYCFGFENVGYKFFVLDFLLVYSKCSVSIEVFFNIFLFSFVIV